MKVTIVCLLVACQSLFTCTAAEVHDAHDRYSTYSNSRFSYSISYPAGILIPQGESDNGDGKKFLSRDGRAEMLVYGSYALDQNLNDLYDEQLRGDGDNSGAKRTVTYEVLRDNWFVVSGYEGDFIFYRKTIFRKGVFKTFVIRYDKSLAYIFNDVARKVTASFKG